VRRTGALLSRYDSQTCQICHICGPLSWPGCWRQLWSLSVCWNGGCAHLQICRLDQIAGLSDLQIHRFADRCPGEVAGVRTTVLVWLLATGLVVHESLFVRMADVHICSFANLSDLHIRRFVDCCPGQVAGFADQCPGVVARDRFDRSVFVRMAASQPCQICTFADVHICRFAGLSDLQICTCSDLVVQERPFSVCYNCRCVKMRTTVLA